MTDINKHIARGAAWMVAFKLIDRGLGLVSTVVLARLLLPADFGLVAMATVIIAALQLLIAFSFDVPLIQNPNAGRAQFDTAWTINVLFGLAAAGVLGLLSYPAASFYSEPRLAHVIHVLALSFAIQALGNIGPVAFRREMRFDQEFRFLLAKRLALLCVTIPLAFWLRSYWALVLGQLLGAVLGVLLSYYASSYRPRFSLAAKGELFHASKWLMLNNLTTFLNGRAAEFLIGRVLGARALGTYTISFEISTLPTTELVAPINRAAFPGYARVASEISQLRSSFLTVVGMIALISLPAALGIVAVADLMVPAVLGQQWMAAVPLIQVLAIFGAIQALQTNISYIYLATGRMHMIAYLGGTQFILLLACMLPFLRWWGVQGAAWAYLASVIVMIPVNQVLLARCLSLGAADFLRCLWRPLAAALVMLAVVLAAKRSVVLPASGGAYLTALLACCALGACIFTAVLWLLWRQSGSPDGPEQVMWERLQAARRRLRRLA
ncbi:oligosaccharide flippase family protein [Pseudoduganella eburnea]|uniref:Oligosaccharide flippase family protein n=1 Tax=Massilia eburnea TaxID=1776165 RepID=A0A6L6QQ53_9BURK|nr:lipopolysaccharide biosynthesis protein [Massilia eburnea]MTW14305.1 oligosaccharide flippase family protein [Massilia eburnea]